MRHFKHLSDDSRRRLFWREPEPFSRDSPRETLSVALGATLYMPATRPRLAHDLTRRAAQGVVSSVVCLEDSIADEDLPAAQANAIAQLRELATTGGGPLVFVRVRQPEQIAEIASGLGEHLPVLSGFVLPKFTESTGAAYLDAIDDTATKHGRRVWAMPVIESPEMIHRETRFDQLTAVRALLDKHRDAVLAVRTGATDLSGVYGIRRGRDLSIYDVRLVAEVITDVVNMLGRADGTGFVVTGPVWEYYSGNERLFKPRLREAPFEASDAEGLRTDLITRDLDGLIREVVLDAANGLTGKTVIHPSHVPVVHALSVVPHEEYVDANDVLGRAAGATASAYGNKMNESRPHRAWAERVLARARVFGVSQPDVGFVDLLGAGAGLVTALADGASQWVADRLDVRLRTTSSPVGLELTDLVGLAVRRNPRRAHLLVSRVLGKHVPTDPRVVRGAGLLLGDLVRAVLVGGEVPAARGEELRAALAGAAAGFDRVVQREPVPAVVLGYAETATALGQQVAEALGAPVLHSTRRRVAGLEPVGGFEEEHSHATSHLLLPADPTLLRTPGTLVLVDDELTTGRTVLNTIAALHADQPRDRYVVAALVDLRTDADRNAMAAVAGRLDTRIDVVALAAGTVELPGDVAERAAVLVAEVADPVAALPSGAPASSGALARVALPWPADLPESARHGWDPADDERRGAAVTRAAAPLAESLGAGASRVLVLGTEELLDVPQRLAAALADGLPGVDVRSSSTTRSPVLAVDGPGYAIRTALAFDAHDDPDDGPGPRFAYNVAGAGFDVIVVVLDERADTPAAAGLLAALATAAPRVVVATLPDTAARVARGRALPPALHGPQFGSYARDEVSWLLTDLSGVALEAPVEEREEAIQSGGAHYAESLPVEYQPSATYAALFEAALEDAAERVARAVGIVTDRALAARGNALTLVSLARAGTPIGILMRRWARHVHGLDVPHHAVSIVRGRGVDHVALRYVAARHDPASVLFVDGWTGKGAIARELAAALVDHRAATGVDFPADLAVLADPGHCVTLYGTRDDFLIPSACLNSTVSGLVSRTVLNRDILRADQFHGAKFYAELSGADVSTRFLDAVTAQFDAVRATVAAAPPAPDEQPDWRGWAAVERISLEQGIGDVNLVKPGVGETTRVLLRRVPWKVLVRADADPADLVHIRHLAAERGVPVEAVPDLPYSCMGLIHPAYTAGATGASGTAVRTASA